MDDSNTLEFVDTFVLLLHVVDLLDPRTSALQRPHAARSECRATNESVERLAPRGVQSTPRASARAAGAARDDSARRAGRGARGARARVHTHQNTRYFGLAVNRTEEVTRTEFGPSRPPFIQ